MWNNLKLVIFLTFTFYQQSNATGLFTIFGSRTIRKGSEFRCEYHLFNMEGETLHIQLTDQGKAIGTKSVTHSNDYESSTTSTVVFNIGDKDLTDVKLRAFIESNSKVTFEQSVKLIAVNKIYSIFIQTDRAVYNPKDTIKYRILALDAETKPFKRSEKLFGVLKLFDGTGHEIIRKDKIIFKNGVFSSEFKISDEPIYGNWSLNFHFYKGSLKNTQQEVKKVIEVKEFVLPRYEVIIDTKPHISLTEQKLIAIVYAQYTFGDLVRGNATVTFQVFDPNHLDQMKYKIEKKVDIIGKKVLEISLKNDLKILNLLGKGYINIEVNFVEAFTGISRNGSANVRIHSQDEFKIQIQQINKRFKPGFPYKFSVILKGFDGSLFRTSDFLSISTTYTFQPREDCGFASKSDTSKQLMSSTFVDLAALENSVAHIEIETFSNTTNLNIVVEIFGKKQNINVTAFASPSNQFLNIDVQTKDLTIDQDVNIKVELTAGQDILNYILFGRNGVILSKSIEEEEQMELWEFSFKATPAMVPEVTLIVYYLQVIGEVVYDFVTLNIDNQLPNNLQIFISKTLVRPKKEVQLTIESKQDSTVYLLGVDQSVLFMKTGFDIDEEMLYNEMMNRNVGMKNEVYEITGSENRYKEFSNTNIFLLTNANNKIKESECAFSRMFATEVDNNQNPEIGEEEFCFDCDAEEVELVDDNRPKIRTDFPETWIFENITMDQNKMTITRKTPETITSWIITGFTLHPMHGIGISKPRKLKVFQPFFIELHLPYSIKVNEILKIPVSIVNNLRSDQNVFVNFFNEKNEFKFMTMNKDRNGICSFNEVQQVVHTNNIKIAKGTKYGINFYIKPQVAGQLKIKITALAGGESDGIEKRINVEHEGSTKYINKPFFVNLKEKPIFEQNYNIQRSKGIFVPNSLKMEASALGDLMGPTLSNLGKLLRLPGGCGEQTMGGILPNVAVASYLKHVGGSAGILNSAIANIQSGYQNMLKFSHSSGGISVWAGHAPSSFLTAYVAKTFSQAKEFITVDGNFLKGTLNYLKSIQNSEGYFPSQGSFYHQEQLDGLKKNDLAVTIYIAIAFLENRDYINDYKSTIDKTLDYLSRRIDQLNTNYLVAMAAYAFQLADNPDYRNQTQNLMKILEKQSEIDIEFLHWENEMKELNPSGKRNTGASYKIEIAAYALLTYIEASKTDENLIFDAAKIMNWLISKRNSLGGFYSTQDTAIGLQALAAMAKENFDPNTNMEISIKNQNNEFRNFTINSNNAKTLQQQELQTQSTNVEIKATGKGFAIVQISQQFNMNIKTPSKWFNLIVKKKPVSNENLLHLEVCTSYNPDADQTHEQAKNSENDEYFDDDDLPNANKKVVIAMEDLLQMVMLEINLPSGFVFDSDALNLLKETPNVEKIEFKDGKTIINMYFERLPRNDICAQVKALRKSEVADLKQAAVKVYLYYDHEKRAIEYYTPDGAKICKE